MTTTQYRVIGSRPVRHDGADKVTGKAIYTADTKLPGMLAGFVLRSPHAHARVVSIDTSQAEAMPGVHAVITGADFPNVEDKVADLGEGWVDQVSVALWLGVWINGSSGKNVFGSGGKGILHRCQIIR